MANIPKHRLEQYKKEKRALKKDKRDRKEGTKKQRVNIIVFCEGKRSEPNYLEALKQLSSSKKNIYIEVEGKGKGTVSLVKKAKNQVEKSCKEYDSVWVVFDKDDFKDFNDAIKMATDCNFNCAWSNEAFELWYVLHFQDLDASVGRTDYIKIIEKHLGEKIADFKYDKASASMYELLTTYGNPNRAAERAEALYQGHQLENSTNYEGYNPCTCMHKLVDVLLNPNQILEAKKK